jgi:hypothetical protein
VKHSIFFIIFFTIYTLLKAEDSNSSEKNITVINSLLSLEAVTVTDEITTNELQSGSPITFCSDTEGLCIIGDQSLAQTTKTELYLKSLPTDQTPAYYLILDDDNQLYKSQYTTLPQKKPSASISNGDLTAIHIETKEINSPSSSLSIETYNPTTSKSTELIIGNATGNITFHTPTIVINTEGILFNGVIFDYQTVFTEAISAPYSLLGKTIVIKGSSTAHESLSIESEQTTISSATLKGKTLTLTGNILPKAALTLSPSDQNTPFLAYLAEGTTDKEGSFLVIDENNALKKTTLPPVSNLIKTNTITSPPESTLTICPLAEETTLTLGTSTSTLLLQQAILNFSTPPTLIATSLTIKGNNQITFKEGLSATIDTTLPYLITDDEVLITSRNTAINSILAFSPEIFFTNLPLLATGSYVLCLLEEEGIGFIRLIPKEAYEKKLAMKRQAYKEKVMQLEQTIYRTTENFYQEKKKYKKALLEHKKAVKKYKKNKKIIILLTNEET